MQVDCPCGLLAFSLSLTSWLFTEINFFPFFPLFPSSCSVLKADHPKDSEGSKKGKKQVRGRGGGGELSPIFDKRPRYFNDGFCYYYYYYYYYCFPFVVRFQPRGPLELKESL